jgi:hypothetical protein
MNHMVSAVSKDIVCRPPRTRSKLTDLECKPLVAKATCVTGQLSAPRSAWTVHDGVRTLPFPSTNHFSTFLGWEGRGLNLVTMRSADLETLNSRVTTALVTTSNVKGTIPPPLLKSAVCASHNSRHAWPADKRRLWVLDDSEGYSGTTKYYQLCD